MLEADIPQHPVFVVVGKPDVIELDGCGRRGEAAWAEQARLNRGLGIDQLEDALRRGHGGLQDVVLLAEVLNGPEETQPVLEERTSTPKVSAP